MILNEILTIVIPCKNEKENIKNILSCLNRQNGSNNLQVFIADCSDDDITHQYIESEKNKNINIEIIEGGFPAKARHNGAVLSKTDYILFLDADMTIKENDYLIKLLNEIIKKDSDLLTSKVRTVDGRFNYVYKLFDLIQKLHRITGPFALGGIMLFKKSAYNNIGGFNPKDLFAEDYNLSRKVKSNKFTVSKSIIYTLSRRFEKKGVSYMLWMMVYSFINRNNRKFFESHHNYWL